MNQTSSAAKKACDKCRLRKIKCDLAKPCASCVARDFECTYATPHRKRGPAGRRLAEIRQQQGWRSAEQLQTPAGLPSPTPLMDPDALDHTSSSTMSASWDMLGCLSAPGQPPPQDAWTTSEDEYLMPASAAPPAPPQPAFDDSMFGLLSRQAPAQPSPGGHLPQPARAGGMAASGWPLGITEENLIRWIDVYFERLYPTLPILKRSSVFARLLAQEHRTNPDFGAMLLALSAFSLIQPVRMSEWSSAASRENMVNFLLAESVKMRAAVEFGESPSLDTLFTSVFLFACMFQRGQHNAAWMRLREAVELGSIFGLARADCYQGCDPEQKQQRLRIYYLLSVTERAYALERKHLITFLGHPAAETRALLESVSGATSNDDMGIVIHDEAEAAGMLGVVQLMTLFDAIDENFVRCWIGQCENPAGGCRFLDQATAVAVYERMSRQQRQRVLQGGGVAGDPDALMADSPPGWPANGKLKDTQVADIMINEQWLLNRFWNLCLSHKLLTPDAEHPALQIQHAVSIAERTLRLCQTLPLSSLEVHGVGQIEKLYCIVESAIAVKRYGETLYYRTSIAENSASPHASGANGITSAPMAGMSPSSMQQHDLIQGFFELFRKIRGGQHAYLGRYAALVGQEIGLENL